MRYLILLFMLIFFSCNKSEDPGALDYMVFGDFYGECGGDCARFFKYSEGKIYADDNYTNHYFGDKLTFQNENIGETVNVENAETIFENLPSALLNSAENTFGCPDCGDWGGIYLEIKQGDLIQSWTLDNAIEGNPEELQELAQKLRDLIDSIVF